MTLLVLIIVIILQRYVPWGEHISRTQWLRSYVTRMQSLLRKTFLWSNVTSVISIMLPVLILVGLIQWLLHGWFLGILKSIFDLVVLYFCLNAYPLKRRLNEYFSALQKEDAINLKEQAIKVVRAKEQQQATSGVMSWARSITREVFLRAEEGFFGVLFWFIVLGPLGAVAYFMAVKLRDMATEINSPWVELSAPANKIFGLLDWIPVRISGLSYALMGYFVAGFNYFRKNFSAGLQQTSEYAIQSGFAALNIEHVDVIHADAEENQAALSLVDRAVYVWIVAVAIFTLGGWL